MTDTRTYHQNCSLALSLDLLGERWTLLIVRELGRGPKRFGDLTDVLPGLGRSMLATRLKRLEATGVIERTELTDGVGAYGLTGRGERLMHALGDLMLWGLELIDDVRPEYETRVVWLAMNMQAVLRRSAEPAPNGTYGFAVGDERFYLHISDQGVTLRDGVPPHPADVTLTAEPYTFHALATGRSPSLDASTVHGDRARLEALLANATVPSSEDIDKLGVDRRPV